MTSQLGLHSPLVKRARRLRSRSGRQVESACLVEGLRVVLTALERGAPVEALIVCPERLTSAPALAAVERAQSAGVAVYEVAPATLESLSERDNPSGLLAIVGATAPSLSALTPAAGDLYVALDEVADPGNLGTVLRTADALGVAGVLLAGSGTDPFHPTAIKASMGALWTVPWAQVPDLLAAIAWAQDEDLATVATTAHDAEALWSAELPARMLLLMGSERHGLPQAVLLDAAHRVGIPMRGSVSSLNLAVATALVVYEVRRRSWVHGP
jgi:TrmH family RNA methyltransferase